MDQDELKTVKATLAVILAVVVVFSIAFFTQKSAETGSTKRSVAEEKPVPGGGGRVMRIRRAFLKEDK